MNLKALNLKWALAFAAAAVVGAMGVVLVLALMRGGDEQATAQPATPTTPPVATEAGGTPVPTWPPSPRYVAEIPSVPTGFTVAEKRSCPDGWQRVSDDVLNYSLCIPPDWGILDYETGERSKELTVHGHGFKILSPEGFPYPAEVPLDKLLQDPDMNLIWIQLAHSSPGTKIACDAKPRAPLGALPAVECEYRFNYTNDPDPRHDIEYRPDGGMIGINIILPMPNQEPDPVDPKIRFGLHIAVVGSEKAMQVHGDTISQILDSVEGQP
jgi:hypothetical protein